MLKSREALHTFLEKLENGLKGPDLSEFVANTQKLRSEHAALFDRSCGQLEIIIRDHH